MRSFCCAAMPVAVARRSAFRLAALVSSTEASPKTGMAAVEKILKSNKDRDAWLKRTDEFLLTMSWDETWDQMASLIDDAVRRKSVPEIPVGKQLEKQPDKAIARQAGLASI